MAIHPHSRLAALLLLGAAASHAQGPATLPEVRVRADRVTPGSLLPIEPANAPLSLGVVGPADLAQPGVRTLSRALQSEPSIGENYAATGYYENFTLRGFTLDLGSSYRINGLLVPGEMHIGLDNKHAVEVLRGTGQLAGGSVGPGGTLNFIARRPADVTSARFEVGSWGASYFGSDVGRFATGTSTLAWRINIAHEEMQPPERRAAGRRDAAALALDLRPLANWRVALDAEYGRRAQPAVPGFQLLGGTTLPDVDPRTNINRQPWSRPVRNESTLLQVRSTHELTADTRLGWAVSDAQARIDDSLAFPFGCNDAPFHFFCADGGYVLYDYRALERRRTTHATATLDGSSKLGAVRHAWRIGAENIRRTVGQQQLYSTTLYDPAGLALSGNLARTADALPAPPASGLDAVGRVATQQAVYAADQFSWGDWSAHASGRWVRIRQTGNVGEGRFLPQLAVSWNAAVGQTFFANVARGLDFGTEAPVAAQNAGALLPPRAVRQLEVGWRRSVDERNASGATVFRMERPFQYTETTGTSWAGLGDFVQRGSQIHTGVELSARAAITRTLNVGAQAALLKAVARGTGDPGLEGMQLQNVPRARTTAWLAVAPTSLPGGRAELRWLHVGARSARPDGLARVLSYDRFDASAAWQWGERLKLQAAVENLANRRYWRDAGAAYGADLLFPGRPRTVTVSLVVDAL